MSPDDVPVPSRRERRAQTGALSTTGSDENADDGVLTIDAVPLADAPTAVAPTVPVFEPVADSPTVPVFEPAADSATAPTFEPAADTMSSLIPGLAAAEPDAAPVVTAPAVAGGRTALAWVDEGTITQPVAPGDLSSAATPYVAVENDLLAHPPRRSPLRAGVVVPTLIIAGIIGAYAGTTLLWPLHAVEPTITAIEAQPVAAPAAAPVWPAAGSAAEAVGGIPGTLSSTADPDSIASITKVVTALLVLDQLPLAPGEQGPEYKFTAADRASYWQYRRGGESALDVPVGGSLTEYQMLQGMLIGSANNYADRLAQGLWPSDAVFASAASAWLSTHGVPGITVYEPTGMNKRNTASPEALVTLAQKALANPVIAEIVATAAVDLPGAGHVVNTNGLLADPGVVGVKTGTLDAWNLLSAKDITVGDTTVRLFASVLGQPDDDARLAASRAIYTQLEQELQLKPSVTAGTVVGIVETRWGDKVDIVTSGDASVILWNGGTGTVGTTFDLGDSRASGDTVGTLSVTGPLDDTTVDLKLAADVSDPSPLWRLTHPLDLFGLNG